MRVGSLGVIGFSPIGVEHGEDLAELVNCRPIRGDVPMASVNLGQKLLGRYCVLR